MNLPGANVLEDQAQTDPWIGRIIDSRYRVTDRIGQGGMGVVYRVEHTRIGKIAALKVLHPNLVSDKSLLRRFKGEAEAISRLSHPNIVQVFDFGRAADTVYLVMEYLQGEDLGVILRRDGPLDLRRCASILIQVCDALTEAHDLGIIHRDLKPENIRVSRTKDGHDFVKVLDFGLAKMIAGERGGESAGITDHGSLVGTPYYMAPEQIRGEALDHRCDIYSLGALLYRMLTGKHAFAAKTPMGVLTKHITEPVEPPSQSGTSLASAPLVMDEIVLTAMAKDRDKRYQNAGQLKATLVRAAAEVRTGEYLQLTPRDSGAGLDVPPQRRASDEHQAVQTDEALQRDGDDNDIAYLPTGPVDVSMLHGEPLLREDLAFERRLRRGRIIKLLVLLPLLAGAAAAAYWFVLREPPDVAPPVEVEPNHQLQAATRIAPDKPILGHLGKRISSEEGDQDLYRLPVSGEGKQQLQASVSSLPNIDIVLELRDGSGGVLSLADSAGVGGHEQITNWPVLPGTFYLLVREFKTVGKLPTENLSDSYRLVASYRKLPPDAELEPNNEPKHANPIEVGARRRGFLGAVDDRDFYAVEAKRGRLKGKVTGVAGADIIIEVHDGSGHRVTIDLGHAGEAESFSSIRSGSKPILILVRRRKQKKTAPGMSPEGLATPYTLTVERE